MSGPPVDRVADWTPTQWAIAMHHYLLGGREVPSADEAGAIVLREWWVERHAEPPEPPRLVLTDHFGNIEAQNVPRETAKQWTKAMFYAVARAHGIIP